METKKDRLIKPASEDPVKEAIGHPNGPSLTEMINGQEEKKLKQDKNAKQAPDDPQIPII